jgi:hypothetical protein
LVSHVSTSLPRVAGVLGLLVAGFVIAHILRLVSEKGLKAPEVAIDGVIEHTGRIDVTPESDNRLWSE